MIVKRTTLGWHCHCGREFPDSAKLAWHEQHEHIAVRENADIESLRQQLDAANTLARQLASALETASHALMSYLYGNDSPDLAIEVSPLIRAALAAAREAGIEID